MPDAKSGRCRAVYSGCVGFDRILWEDIIAGSAAVLEVCGAKDVQLTRVRGGGDGDTELDIIAEWR